MKLTRYVARSPTVEDGYNSYFYVNDRKATLSDFDSLLAHARISAEGYNIVQQGDVSRIVEMSPVERRRILEERAGISRFDEDIQKAEGKRDGVEEDLDRIEIILDEIRRQLRRLEKDREDALRYREIQAELDAARAQEAHKELEILAQQVASTRDQVRRYEADRDGLRAERDTVRERLAAAEEKLASLEDEVARRGGAEFQEVKERLDGLRVERARAQDVMERGAEDVRSLRAEVARIHKERKKVREEAAQRREEREEVAARIAEEEDARRGHEEEIARLEEEASRSDRRLVDLQKELVAQERERDGVETERKELVLEREKTAQDLARLEAEIAQQSEEREAVAFEAEDAAWQAKETAAAARGVRKKVDWLHEQYEERSAERKELAQQAAELRSAVQRLSREYSQLKAEAEAAENVQRGYTRAVQAILEARDKGELPGVHGTVAELAEVKEEHEVALNTAAGSRMQAIVVEDDGVAARAIARLKKQKLGRAIFLPLNKMLPGRPRGKAILAEREAVGFAIDLVSFDEEYRNAFWYVFGDTVVVETLDQARDLMGGVRLVTLDGQRVEASGAMVGGQTQTVSLKFGQAAKGRLEDVGERLRTAREELQKVEDRLEELEPEVEELQARLREMEAEGDRRTAQREDRDRRKLELQGRVTALEADLEEKGRLREARREELAALEAKVEDVEARLETLQETREAARERIADVTPQRIAERLRELQRAQLAVGETLGDRKARRDTLEAQIDLLEEREAELTQRLEEVETSIDSVEAERAAAKKRLGAVEEEIRGLQKMEERTLQETEDLRDRRDAAFKERTGLEARTEKIRDKLETTEDFLVGLEGQLETLREKVADAEERVAELPPVDGDLPPMETIKQVVARCERDLGAIGAVNLRALEDYEVQEAREAELSEELARLRKERKNLLQLVEELEARKREGLLRVFHALRENFGEVYRELSEGGDAELLLEDEEDPFQGGLVIRARPPQKRFLRLEALSGGEKSLVSMAFIFALQEYEPSPFYLLDEVDQNLDAVNAERIARMIRRNSSSAQFVQISLRKVSLKEADHILGVTMGKNGVSEVIMQVHLDDVVEEPAPEEAMT